MGFRLSVEIALAAHAPHRILGAVVVFLQSRAYILGAVGLIIVAKDVVKRVVFVLRAQKSDGGLRRLWVASVSHGKAGRCCCGHRCKSALLVRSHNAFTPLQVHNHLRGYYITRRLSYA